MVDRLFTRRLSAGFLVVTLLSVGGCVASYAAPGRGANMQLLTAAARDQQTDSPVQEALSRQPLAKLPTAIAVVRIQAPGYQSQTAQCWGRGAYSVITTRDIENSDELMARLGKLPMVSGLAPINRMLLPAEFHSDLELRQAAAALHADMVLIYTLDTTFNVQDVALPLSVVTLGLSPNEVAHVICTASAVLLDTRNGYVYGVAEATADQKQLASAWTNAAAVDQARRRVEAKAFEKLVGQTEKTWQGVVTNLTAASSASAP